MTDPESSILPEEVRQRRALEFHLFTHIESQIALGESRASVLLAADALLAAAYATLLKSQGAIGLSPVAASPIFLAAAAALAASLLLALLAISPALASTRFFKPGEDLTFFSSIATLERSRFEERFRAASADKLESHLLGSIWGKSRKAKDKFTMLFCATIATGLSVVLFLIGVASAGDWSA